MIQWCMGYPEILPTHKIVVNYEEVLCGFTFTIFQISSKYLNLTYLLIFKCSSCYCKFEFLIAVIRDNEILNNIFFVSSFVIFWNCNVFSCTVYEKHWFEHFVFPCALLNLICKISSFCKIGKCTKYSFSLTFAYSERDNIIFSFFLIK